MALRDIFKKKKKEEVKPVEKPKEEISSEKPSAVTRALAKGEDERSSSTRVKKSAEFVTPQVKKKVRDNEAYRILKSPHVTEKATDLTKKNQYVFKVFSKANKSEIKKAIGGLYGVDVISVKIINIPSKKRRLGRISGWKPGYKKAIIGIKEGQTIEVLPR